MWVEQFIALDRVLTRYQSYWQFQPMQGQWPALPTDLQAKLQSLGMAECAEFDADDEKLQKLFAPWLPDLLAAQPTLPMWQGEVTKAPFWLSTDIPGRKWQQISLFASATAQPKLPVMEWCAGKGHLGRLLAFSQQRPVQSIEWQAALCQAGEAKAQQLGIPQQFHCVDVLNDSTEAYFAIEQQWLALHACGDLHRIGLKQAMAAGTQVIGLLPCCYHLQQAPYYQPWSAPAQASALRLDKTALRLAVQQRCTGGARVNRLGDTELLWRHVWRLWSLQQGQIYRPLQSVAKHWFSGSIADFLDFAGEQHQLPVPNAAQLPPLVAAAADALLLQRQLELLQHFFRRPLELWLVFDLAIALQQAGYQVSVQQLCEPSLTPRNLLLQAWR